MSPADLEFHPEAVAEARAAREWYTERSAEAAEAFVVELDHAIEFIVASPDRWPTYLHETRRYLLRRFPYSVIYRQMPGILRVIAVMHARRRPGYWRTRE